MRQIVVHRGLAASNPGAPNTGATATKCLFEVYDNATTVQTLTDCVVAVVNASAQYTNLGGALWDAALNGAKQTAIEIGSAETALVIAYSAFAWLAGESVASTIVTELVYAIADLIVTVAADVGIVITVVGVSSAIGSAFGPAGMAVGAVIGAIISVTNYLVAYDSHLQITNGTTLAVRDYGGIVNTAAQWLQHASPEAIVGLTGLSFSNQATIFLANPTWLYGNQVLIGLPQPSPPDQGHGSGIDVAYTQLPGAYELLNTRQVSDAILFVAANYGRLPMFSSIPKPTGAPIQIAGWPVDPAMVQIANPNNYNPMWTQGLLAWVPPGIVTQGSGPVAAVGDPSVWPAGNNFGGGGGPELQAPTISGDNPMGPNITYQSYIYASCPNLASNDNTRDASGRITGQTNMAPGIFLLQAMYPTLTTSQCLMIFTAALPHYNKTLNDAQAWANTQCYVSSPDLIAQYGLAPIDADAIVAKWVSPDPGCISKHDAMVLLQYWVNQQCPAPTPEKAWQQTGSASGPLTLIDAQTVVNGWSNLTCAVPVTSPATTTKSTLVRGAALVGGLGALGVAWYAARNGVTVTRAASTLLNTTKQAVTSSVKKLKPKMRARR